MWGRGLKHVAQHWQDARHLSPPMWGRGLKLYLGNLKTYLIVAPHVGAWIETLIVTFALGLFEVAPHVGAWIETVSRLA